jgi:hypothetical protein
VLGGGSTTSEIGENIAVAGAARARSAEDEDRIEGAAAQAKGAVKEAVGKVVGDAKLHARRQGRRGGRQAAERGRRAEERDPQDLRELPEKPGRGAPGTWGCGLLRLCRGPRREA